MSRLLPYILLAAGTASAAPPVASYIFPAGGQRGTTVPVRVGGLFVHESCGFALDGSGVKASPELKPGKRIWFEGPIIPLPDSQQAEDYPVDMLGTVAVDAKAALGSRRGRIWTSQGVATGPVFVVGDLPEVIETEIDGDPIPEPVTLPATANGRVFPREDIDLWSVKLTKGQTVSALAATAGIRSPLVAKLEIVDAKGAVLAQSGSRAALGCDVSVRFTAPAEGTYHVRIADARGQGGPAFVYRLTMTTDPVADSIFPLGGQRGETIKLNGDKAIAIPADAPAQWATRLGSQAVTLDSDDLPEFVEAPANAVAPPAVFNGRIEPGAVGAWKVELKKAKKYEIELRAKKLGSPLCGTLVVLDAEGKEVAKHTPDDPGCESPRDRDETDACPSGRALCGGTCRDTQMDTTNCGSCGVVCPVGASCDFGRCNCPAGLTDCGARCVNPTNNTAHCGECGNVCPAGQTCSGGRCESECPSPRQMCGATCLDTSSDILNCGACNRACALANATVRCVSGACAVNVCSTGFGDCDGVSSNGCETPLSMNASHCGRCGGVCGSGYVCSSGNCCRSQPPCTTHCCELDVCGQCTRCVSMMQMCS